MFSRRFVLSITSAFLLSLACPPAVFAAEDEAPAPAKPTSQEDTYELLNLFGDVFERVRRDYVEPVSDKDLIESAINGMLTSLDPHSSYLNEKSFEEMQVQTKGEFGGLGIEVTMDNGLVKVVSPIDDTPAFKAGVQPGDYISQIDGEPVLGMTLSEAVEKMRGPIGTDIKISLLREGLKEPLDVTIRRDLIRIKSVRSRAEGDIGYVRITSFSETTYEGLEKAVKDLHGQIKDMKGVVLDLRNNPGGLLDQAVAVADGFLNQGEIVSTRERDPQNTKRYSATPGDLINNLPLVVLINKGSASASEIVAGALQDHKRAVIMGIKSFGKGSVQTVIPLKDHGAMRLTTSRYYTPSGHSIQAKGISPDIEVEQAKIEMVDSTDKMRSEADLPGRLASEEEQKNGFVRKSKDILYPPEQMKKTNDKNKNIKPGEGETGDLDSAQDFQLARALDLLRGLAKYREISTQ